MAADEGRLESVQVDEGRGAEPESSVLIVTEIEHGGIGGDVLVAEIDLSVDVAVLRVDREVVSRARERSVAGESPRKLDEVATKRGLDLLGLAVAFEIERGELDLDLVEQLDANMPIEEVGRTIALLAAAASLGLIGSVYVSQRQAGERLDRLRQPSETWALLAELEFRQTRLVRGLEGSSSCANEHVLLGTRRSLEVQRPALSRIVALSRRHRLLLIVELRRSGGEQRQVSILTLAAAGSFGFTIAFLALVRRQRFLDS